MPPTPPLCPPDDLVNLLYALTFEGNSAAGPDGKIYLTLDAGGRLIFGIIYDPLDTAPPIAHIHSEEWKVRFRIPKEWPNHWSLGTRMIGSTKRKTYIHSVEFEGDEAAFNRDLTYFKLMG